MDKIYLLVGRQFKFIVKFQGRPLAHTGERFTGSNLILTAHMAIRSKLLIFGIRINEDPYA